MLATPSSDADVDVDDPASAAEDAPEAEPDVAVAGGSHRKRWLAALVVVVGLVAGFYIVTAVSTPPAGTIWFGTSFDPDTYAIQGRLTSVPDDESFVMVGQLTRPVAGGRLVIRAYLNDALLSISWTSLTDQTDLWGFRIDPLGPLPMPGNWRYEIAEIGGDALASGQILVTAD